MTVDPEVPKVVRRPQLSDEAATFVRAQIMSGKLKPGDSVRVDTIAEALSISTTPAREALKTLRVEGFLDLIPRRGFQVAHLSSADIKDLFTVQALVAGEMVARAVANATPDDVARLRTLHDQLGKAAKANDIAQLEELNHQFHRELNKLGNSPKILWVLGLLTRYVPRMYYASIPGWPESTMTDHDAILAAFEESDPEAGRAAMHAHLLHSGELLAANFDRRVGGETTAQSEGGPD
ncbi:GntR family transcriptional regulator [Ornithinimicrobium cavernae]|uniref:GntR family transcriptional regulator n=1 Tax=Ornithinimicrobium cavernae TaxID=2666047 RepID=UPI001F289D99|nr:GntR family transcriptional regulator [Ornithinimicrobium cavernae]